MVGMSWKRGAKKRKERGKEKSGQGGRGWESEIREERGAGSLFCESSHVRLAGCPRHTAEKSI